LDDGHGSLARVILPPLSDPEIRAATEVRYAVLRGRGRGPFHERAELQILDPNVRLCRSIAQGLKRVALVRIEFCTVSMQPVDRESIELVPLEDRNGYGRSGTGPIEFRCNVAVQIAYLQQPSFRCEEPNQIVLLFESQGR
jgi:hypothetical protein